MYENKNDNTYLIIPVSWNERNEKVLEEALDWLRLVYQNWKDAEGTNDNIPKRPWTRKNKISGRVRYTNCAGRLTPRVIQTMRRKFQQVM